MTIANKPATFAELSNVAKDPKRQAAVMRECQTIEGARLFAASMREHNAEVAAEISDEALASYLSRLANGRVSVFANGGGVSMTGG